MNELSALASSLGSLLKERKETIAVAESSAGGLISAALLAVPGASAYFLGGGVIYTAAARRALLGVPDTALAGIRSSTEAYALVKARAIRERLGTTWGLAETGATGPTGNRYGGASPSPARSSARSRWRRGTTIASATCGALPEPRSSSWTRHSVEDRRAPCESDSSDSASWAVPWRSTCERPATT